MTEAAANSPRAFELPAFDQRTSTADRPTQPRREQYRVDAADHVHGSHYGRKPSSAPLSTQVAHWHAALAPRAGVAATVVLILAVSLLYWFTVGRQRGAVEADDRLDLPSAWSSESLPAPPLSAVIRPFDEQAAAGSTPSLEIKTPRVADATAAASTVASPAVETPSQFETAVGSTGMVGPLFKPTLPMTASAEATASAPSADEPITPTPNDLPYPVTGYPEFNFGPPASGPPVAGPPATASSGN